MSTNKQKFNKRHGQPLNKSNSKAEISKLSGVSMSILNQVYDRGLGAHKTNPQSVRNVKGVKGGPGKKMELLEEQQIKIYGRSIPLKKNNLYYIQCLLVQVHMEKRKELVKCLRLLLRKLKVLKKKNDTNI